MTWGKKFIALAVLVVVFGGGIVFDRFLRNFPLFKWDSEVSIVEILQLLVTIFIAVMIPFWTERLMENKKGIKILLVDELKELMAILVEIRAIISASYTKGVFEAADKDRIIYIFNDAELKLGSIVEQAKIGFSDKWEDTEKSLTDLFFVYQDYVTGGELMVSSFAKIDDRFYREHATEYSKLETGVKVFIQQVFKF